MRSYQLALSGTNRFSWGDLNDAERADIAIFEARFPSQPSSLARAGNRPKSS